MLRGLALADGLVPFRDCLLVGDEELVFVALEDLSVRALEIIHIPENLPHLVLLKPSLEKQPMIILRNNKRIMPAKLILNRIQQFHRIIRLSIPTEIDPRPIIPSKLLNLALRILPLPQLINIEQILPQLLIQLPELKRAGIIGHEVWIVDEPITDNQNTILAILTHFGRVFEKFMIRDLHEILLSSRGQTRSADSVIVLFLELFLVISADEFLG